MLPMIPFTPKPAIVVPAPLDFDGDTAIDPEGTVVTITARQVTETDLVVDEDGETTEVSLPDRTVFDVRINGNQRSVHGSRDEALRVVESYRVSPGGLAQA